LKEEIEMRNTMTVKEKKGFRYFGWGFLLLAVMTYVYDCIRFSPIPSGYVVVWFITGLWFIILTKIK
jgi:hypothetical protein